MNSKLRAGKQTFLQLWRSASSVIVAAAMVSTSALGITLVRPGSAIAADMTDCTPGGATAASYNSTNLSLFKTALTQTSTKPVNIVYVGDSLTEGYGATSDTAPSA